MGSPNLCCCCSLKTGGTIIAILDIIGGILLIVGGIAAFGVGAVVKTRQDYSGHSSEKDIAVVSTLMYIVGAMLLIAGACSIIIGVLLLAGISKRSSDLLKIWIIIRAVLLVVVVLGYIGGHNGEKPTEAGSLSPGVSTALHVIFNLIFGLWFISVVHYLRREFLEDRAGNTAPAYSSYKA